MRKATLQTFILILTLAPLWSGSGARIPVKHVTTVNFSTPAQTTRLGNAPDGRRLSGWQAIQSQIAKLTAADGMQDDHFGVSLSVDGDTAIIGADDADIGANSNQGTAYIFYRNQGGANAWDQAAKLTAADGATNDNFGSVVSINGDTAVIGAAGADIADKDNQGAVYIFYRNQGGANAWGQVAKLTAADGATNDNFGSAVSVNGDMTVIGAIGADIADNINQGAAYVFYRNQGGADAWGQAAKLSAIDGATSDMFGESVSISEDIVFVRGYRADIAGNIDQGAVYVFYRDRGGANAWGQAAKLTAADGAAYDLFGCYVSVDDGTAVVGATGADSPGKDDQGAAYIFYRNQGGADAWGQAAKITTADGEANDHFGRSVSIDGDMIVIGADGADLAGNVSQGAAYVYYRNQGGVNIWGQVSKLIAADGAAGDLFGHSVSISQNMVLVGASGADSPGKDDRGAAYVVIVSNPVQNHGVHLPLVIRNHTSLPK